MAAFFRKPLFYPLALRIFTGRCDRQVAAIANKKSRVGRPNAAFCNDNDVSE